MAGCARHAKASPMIKTVRMALRTISSLESPDVESCRPRATAPK